MVLRSKAVEHSEANMCYCCEKSEASDKPIWALAEYQKSKYENGQFCSKCWDLIGKTNINMTLDQMVKIVQLSSFSHGELSKNIHLYIESNERLLAKLNDAVRSEEVIDPYKAHEEKLRNNLSYRQFLLNQHECVLCGEKGVNRVIDGVGRYSPIIRAMLPKSLPNETHVHQECWTLITSFACVKRMTLEDALKELKAIFKKNVKSSHAIAQEAIVEGFGDHSGNPWNRK